MSFQIRKSHYARKVAGKWVYKWNGRWNVVYQKDSGKSGKKQDALKKGSKEFLDKGFTLDMDYERAKEVAERLNSEEKIKREHEKQLRVQERVRKSDIVRSAYLPKKLVLEFESTIMVEKRLNHSHWLKAIEVISAVAIDPSDWYDRPSAIYKKFEDLKLSPDYSRRVLRLMNEWGRRADLTGKLVSAAATVSQGFLFKSSIPCIRRPKRRPCSGVIHFRRFDEPQEEIKWFCLKCDDNGSISEWKKTIDDFRSIHANANIHLEPLSELFVTDVEFQLLVNLHPPIENVERYRIESGQMLLGTIAEMEPLLGGVAHSRTQANDPEEKKNLLDLFERLEEDLWISKDLKEVLGNNARPN